MKLLITYYSGLAGEQANGRTGGYFDCCGSSKVLTDLKKSNLKLYKSQTSDIFLTNQTLTLTYSRTVLHNHYDHFEEANFDQTSLCCNVEAET